MNYLLVGLGGMLGSVSRYLVSSLTVHSFPNTKFPIGTFLVNSIGCLLIGALAVVIEQFSHLNAEIRLFAITGVLGGFTTFSAFSAETLYLIREGEITIALTYVGLSVFCGIVLAFLGFKVANFIPS